MKKIFTLLTFVFFTSAMLFGQCPDVATPNPTNKTFNMNYVLEADRDAAFANLASITFPSGTGAPTSPTVTILKADLTTDATSSGVYRIRAITTIDDHFGGENGNFAGILTFTNTDETFITCEYTVTTSVDDLNESSSIQVFPNPVQDQLTLIDGKGQVTIYNVLGQAVKQLTINTTQATIQVAGLLNGRYFLQVLQEDGKSTTKQFSKAD